MKRDRTLAVVGVLFAIVCTAFFSFMAGQWWGTKTAESGIGRVVVLKENQTILAEAGHETGFLPKGMKLYVVPDPHANELSLFKAYFQANDSNKSIAPDDSTTEKHLRTNFIRVESEGTK